MKLAQILQTRPWSAASLASARPYAAMCQQTKQRDSGARRTPYGGSRGSNFEDDFQDFKPSEKDARDLLFKIREENMSRMTVAGVELRVRRVEERHEGGYWRWSQEQTQEQIRQEIEDGAPWSQEIGAPWSHELGGEAPWSQTFGDSSGMGSFTSAPAVAAGDCQDAALEFPACGGADLLARCGQELAHLPAPLNRTFRKYSFQHTLPNINKDTDRIEDDGNIRLFQWNHLSQTLGTKNDKFVVCPPEALVWETRRWRLLEEILRYQPDVVCLQEVDHFSLLERALASVGYSGRFVPKPDSPCIYLADNNGPDGCAIFVRDDKFDILEVGSRILEVWRVQSNQVVLALNLRHKGTGREVCVATTHLKARQGALLSTLRNEQGKDMLDWLAGRAGGRPLLLSGDFNADPSEPVYHSVTSHEELRLSSAYKAGQYTGDGTADYTTWKVRETGEQKYVLDYIFHSAGLQPVAVLEMPTEAEVGENRLPSLKFASDHLSLVADFSLV